MSSKNPSGSDSADRASLTPSLLPPPLRSDSPLEDLKQVLNVLRAYVLTFGRPDSALGLRAVVGAIVANSVNVQIENGQLEGFIDEAIAAFESLGIEAAFVDVSAQMLAEQVAVWLKEQEMTVGNVISAYLQHFAPDDAVWDVGEMMGLVQTVIATLNDGSLSRSGGRALVEQVLKAFDLEQALSRWVAPEWVALAQRVANYARHGDLQREVWAIAWACIQQYQTILSPKLIEKIALSQASGVFADGLFGADAGEFSQVLYYKFQLLEADPIVTKSHWAIAAELQVAIAALNAQRAPVLDITKGEQAGNLEIRSPFRRTKNE